MLKAFNALLVIAVLVSSAVLYSLEHSTRGFEREIAKTQKATANERERTKLLNAEWASLTRPARIQKLASEQLKLSTLTASQIVPLAEVGAKVPATPVVKLEAQNADPIGDILEKMQ